MEQSAVLSTSYWGPVIYFACFIKHQNISIEAHEIYQKQSFRNRCEIYGPNGLQSLQVPVLRGSFHKINIKDIQIAYDTQWQKNHFKSIEAAYRSAPYYEFLIDDIMPFYTKSQKYLWDFNHMILELCKEWLKLDTFVDETQNFIKDYGEFDYRNKIHPKIAFETQAPLFIAKPYTQGFENRHGFVGNLSILDLMFNCGPQAKAVIIDGLNLPK